MKKILPILISITLISCGSVNKKNFTSSQELNKNISLQNEKVLSAVSNSIENSSVKIENEGYKITVKPVSGQNSFFNFTSPGGNIFQGTTNAELQFEKSSERKEINVERKVITKVSYQTKTTYKSMTRFKTVTKYSEKVKKYSFWYYFFIAGFLSSYLIKFFWNLIKKSNWFINIYNNLIKK